MKSTTAFTVYNAAAGAGKTYTLVKEYLVTLLKGQYKDAYKNILAITFTNKAVAEMKIRILENLVALSTTPTPVAYQNLLEDLVVQTNISEEQLKRKTVRILKSILHNYAAFDVVTIDTFTHRILRTFAYDLGLPINFEIEMDVEGLIIEAVDNLVAKIGLDEAITHLIIDFAMRKLEEDKSWDITIELTKIAKLLFSENDRQPLNRLSDKSLDDFEGLKKVVRDKIETHKKVIVSKAKRILELLEDNHLDASDFTRSSIPNHFKKLSNGELLIDFKAAWKQDIHRASFYNAKLDSAKKDKIDHIRPQIEDAFLLTKQQLIETNFLKNCLKNSTPIAVLNAIQKELKAIQKERKILLISEFNTIINRSVQGQPAPFIYERLGERYQDYFIDEFQDTSALQWNNLIPLIDNAVATETLSGKRGRITIVGDAKQAIYRWRGGKAEQFIALSSDQNPFSVKEKQVLNLPKNYRSHEEIIKFNNSFFTFLSQEFSNDTHRQLYLSGNKQEVNTKKNGYIDISFIKASNAIEEQEAYPLKVYETVLELQSKGYTPADICIIVRKQKEGVVIANYLSEKGLSIISSETLLIKNAPEVLFIVNLIKWYFQPNDLHAKVDMLQFLSKETPLEEKHLFLQEMIHTTKNEFVGYLKNQGIFFDFDQLALRPLYDAIAYIITSFNLAKKAPAYLQFFLDVVFGYAQQYTEGILGFLSYWETKKDNLSIVAPDTDKAIRIMTIHKAKGLEFPCVVYPFANTDIYREIEPKAWIEVNPEDFFGFKEVFVDYNKSIEAYTEHANTIVSERQAQLELDAFNLLYVVFTRAKEQLYIISKLDLNSKGEYFPNKFSGKLIAYLENIGRWNADIAQYTFGDFKKPTGITPQVKSKNQTLLITGFEDASKTYKTHIVTHASKLWDTRQEDAIEKGNLIHNIMSLIYTEKDIHRVIKETYRKGEISLHEQEVLLQEIQNLINHPELSTYFSKENEIYNERDLLYNGTLFRPDRIVIDPYKKTTVIDYKTGSYRESHATQIRKYAQILNDMGYLIENKILIYINERITLKYV
ncbi:UvrD-helicase domain-containing protein [Aquimarina sp. U1-2]|uniref:UvrD-helicase domain-containing protein n=1 Tax=Aquimarina sp. U1-2 TaxID=2823141 RepID=UPI001AEC98BD|nr:UvrD-helicase domain-containing protein [Aquimarina sp. U1-2]MBP2831174.1 UvrD-helicase domain-containing protein [Aquimarina sp. U1-2]